MNAKCVGNPFVLIVISIIQIALAQGQIAKLMIETEKKIDLLSAISLMSTSKIHKDLKLSDIDRLIAAPIALGQYRLWFIDGWPVCYSSWGYLSPEARDRHLARAGLVRAADWNSGDELWFMDFIAPFGNVQKYVRDLYKQFPMHKIAFTSRSYGTGKVQRLGSYRNV